MTEYRRVRVPGATWFFTVGLAERRGNGLLVERIDTLRSAFRVVRERHPFLMDAVVILPDHLHCVWTLPEGDADYSTRWGLIKAKFSRSLNRGERRSASRVKRGERGIWQRRFWEHCIRDEGDYARHVDYVHWPLRQPLPALLYLLHPCSRLRILRRARMHKCRGRQEAGSDRPRHWCISATAPALLYLPPSVAVACTAECTRST